MVLTYPGRLPEGALVRVDKITRPPAPIWLDARQGVTLTEAGRVQSWTARRGTATALPVPANPNGTFYIGQSLQFEAGENGGLVLSAAIPDASTVAFGAILTPDQPDARSILALQPLGSEGYVFLSLEGSVLRLVRRGAADEIALILPRHEGPLLILCTLQAGQAQISVNGQVAEGVLAMEAAAAELFIGCRNGKGGMKGKLGSFALSDVLIWPEGGETSGAEALWRERCGLDV